jgi:hypothetical protein
MMEPLGSSGGELGIVFAAVGFVGIVIGFGWIRRITRSDDDGPSSWRSHR